MGFVLPPSKLYVHALSLDELTDLINAEGEVNREGGRGFKWVDRGTFGHANLATL